jgi:hypothetical protein
MLSVSYATNQNLSNGTLELIQWCQIPIREGYGWLWVARGEEKAAYLPSHRDGVVVSNGTNENLSNGTLEFAQWNQVLETVCGVLDFAPYYHGN